MNLYELESSEANPVYQAMESTNYARHYDFLLSMIQVAIESEKTWLSESLIKALNFHAIVSLHPQAGEYRTVDVAAGIYDAPPPYRVQPLMEDFVNEINRNWEASGSVILATYALWKLNQIHPFINGNGRTARAVCYSIFCLKVGRQLRGDIILPDVIRKYPRAEYVQALRDADSGNLQPLIALVTECLREQFRQA